MYNTNKDVIILQNRLIDDINNYISYLNKKGLSVSVHGKTVGGLIEHNIHRNPYCSFIKTNSAAWEKCVKCQQKIFNICNNDFFFGMCYAGVEEYVFYADAKTFISISGYGIDRKKAMLRINRLSNEFYFDKNDLLTVYEQGLKHEKENTDDLMVLIRPLCHMLSLLQITIGDITYSETKNKTFDSVLAYVQRNYMQDLSLGEIAVSCACSESTLSHLFKEYTNQSVKKYINNLRIKQAEKLLMTSDLPIGNIALLCGFSNTNYFATAFKKQNGISPTQYRRGYAEKSQITV